MQASASTMPISLELPNGMHVFGLNPNDTLNVYTDIFSDNCYLRHGIEIREGDCIFDIGANTGLFILYLSQRFSNLRIYGFEPAPRTFQALEKNIREHVHGQVELFNVGIAREKGKAELTFYPRFSNASTFFPAKDAKLAEVGRQYVLTQMHTLPWGVRHVCALLPPFVQHGIAELVRRWYLKEEVVTCRLWNLSEFMARKGIERIDLLKIDAEKSEQDILAGIADQDWAKIRQLVVEVHDGEDAVVTRLRSLGYRVTVDHNPAMPALALVFAVR